MAKDFTHKSQNERTIQKAMNRFLANKELILRNGMYRLLDNAVETALKLHDDTHQSHVELGDTYGWMLVVDGNVDRIHVKSNGDKVGQASAMLRTYASKVPNIGMVGIVMAGMQPANFFTINYEKGILESTIQITRQNFYQYFRKI